MAIPMCDEYDDERMRAFWRAIERAKALPVLEEDAVPAPAISALTTETPQASRKPKALLR